MRTERDTTYTQNVDVPVSQRDDFVPSRPDPSGWHIDQKQFVMSAKDQLYMLCVVACIVLMAIIATVTFAVTADVWTSPVSAKPNTDGPSQETQGEVDAPNIDKGAFADGAEGNVLYGTADGFKTIGQSDMTATYAAIADVSAGKLVAGLGEDTRVYPASLTKVMTLVVVVEHIKDEAALQNQITISQSVVEAMSKEGASGIGLATGEKLTVESLLYALMLQSDGVAACELAKYVAGTEAAFVALMNQKAADMGLTNTHFENPTGLHHDNHYSSCRDLATLMGYAMNMSLCRKVMTEDYQQAICDSPSAGEFPYHIYNNLLETYFKKYKSLTPAKAGSLTIIAGKTGYTPESKYCLVTCAQGADGKYYVCVTTGASSYEQCIRSYQSLYSKYVG